MALLKTPSSTAVVDVPDELVGTYEAAGWVAVKSEPKEQPKPRKRAAAATEK